MPERRAPLPDGRGFQLLPAYSAFLAIRFLVKRPVYLISVLGVTLSVWAAITIIAVLAGFIEGLREGIRDAAPQLICTGLPPRTDFGPLDARIRSDQDVVATAPRLRHYAMYFPHGRGNKATSTLKMMASSTSFDYVELIGIDPEREGETTGFRNWLRAADGQGFGVLDEVRPFWIPPRHEQISGQSGVDSGPLLSSSRPILLSRPRIERRDLRIGQPLSLVSGRFEQVDGSTELRMAGYKFALAGGFETRDPAFDAAKALVDIADLQELLGYHFDPLGDAVDPISDIAIRVRDGVDPALVADRLRTALADDYGATILTWEQQNDVFLGAIDQERGNISVILFVVMMVAAFLIYATLRTTVTQKIKEIGVLSAMGAAPYGVLQVFLSAGMLVATIGCGLGLAAGVASAVYLNEINDTFRFVLGIELFPKHVFALDRIPARVEPWWLCQVVASALLVSFLAAWLPARRAARLDPVRALAYE